MANNLMGFEECVVNLDSDSAWEPWTDEEFIVAPDFGENEIKVCIGGLEYNLTEMPNGVMHIDAPGIGSVHIVLARGKRAE